MFNVISSLKLVAWRSTQRIGEHYATLRPAQHAEPRP